MDIDRTVKIRLFFSELPDNVPIQNTKTNTLNTSGTKRKYLHRIWGFKDLFLHSLRKMVLLLSPITVAPTIPQLKRRVRNPKLVGSNHTLKHNWIKTPTEEISPTDIMSLSVCQDRLSNRSLGFMTLNQMRSWRREMYLGFQARTKVKKLFLLVALLVLEGHLKGTRWAARKIGQIGKIADTRSSRYLVGQI